METIEWLNHAGYIFRHGETAIACDPWLTGTAFDRGWRLLSPSVFRPEDFAGVTHIWFSHQHPDHFSPADLRAIPADIRAKITILFHETIDKKVIRYCTGLKFRACIEIRDEEWTRVSDDVSILCGAWSDRDSWLAMRTPQQTILNLNDCVIDTASAANMVAKKVGRVDVLLTQFSYANWVGNADDRAMREAQAKRKLDAIRTQAAAIKPKTIIPFASFVWFSHAENFHFNREMNQVQDVAAFIERETEAKAVVLYPGDSWQVGAAHDWRAASERYAADFENAIAQGPVDKHDSVPFEKLESAMREYLRRLKARNPLLPFIPGLRTSIHLRDTQRSYALTLKGMRQLPYADPTDIEAHSEALYFALRMPWGSNALSVNGRYHDNGGRVRFFRFFRAADLNDLGLGFDFPWLIEQIGKAARKVFRRKSP